MPRSQIALGEGFALIDEEGAGDVGYFAGAGELRLEVFDQLLDELAGQGSIATLHKRLEAEPYEGLGLRAVLHIEVGRIDDARLGAQAIDETTAQELTHELEAQATA